MMAVDKETARKIWLTVLLVAMFTVFVVFRVMYQQGKQLLKGMYPWNWIALVVIFAALIYGIHRVSRAVKE